MDAAHILSYRHGQDTMDAIISRNATPELFSSHNGVLMNYQADCSSIKYTMLLCPNVSKSILARDQGLA